MAQVPSADMERLAAIHAEAFATPWSEAELDALAAQDYLYTLYELGDQPDTEVRVIGAISGMLLAEDGATLFAAAERAGRLLRLQHSIVLLPSAPEEARRNLAELEQPFTLSAARRALGTTRRVAIPLLEYLDAQRITRRGEGGCRTLR